MKIHCLNLARATERKLRITQEWVEKKGFEVEYFTAVDRRDVDDGNDMPFVYDPAATVARIKRQLTSGEIACATSHALLLRQALAAGAEEIIVLEDDMLPFAQTTPASVAAAIDVCKATFPKVGVLLMHEPAGESVSREIRDGINLLRRAPYGFRFVWLNKKAMQILSHDLASLMYPADWLWNLRFAPMRQVAMLESPLSHHPEDQTYIGNTFRLDQREYVP